MRRILFLLAAGAAALPGQQYRGFWADAFNPGFKTPAQVDQLVEDLAAAKANGVWVEARRRADSYFFHSAEPPAQDPDYSPTFDALAYLIERAHARGIEVHLWGPVYPVYSASAGPPADNAHVWYKHGPRTSGDAMWMTVSSRGALSQTSLDPGHPGVLRYSVEAFLEPARHYNLDGLHLDYVRYPEDADYGWNPAAVARYQRLRNKTGIPASGDADFAAFRREQVTAFVRQLYLRANAIRPSLKLSAAAITWGDGPKTDAEFRTRDAYSRVFQDWRGWLDEGIVDLAMPMNYFRETPQYTPMFDRWIEFEKDHQGKRAVLIGPAIYLNPVADSMAQLRRALAPSAAGNRVPGVCFYSYAGTNSLQAANGDFYQAAGGAFRTAAGIPPLAWKTAPAAGHIMGTLQVDGGEAWLHDGAAVFIESDTGGKSVQTVTDGTGFFGAVDLPPDRYRVRIERGGRELYRSTPNDLAAGAVVSFDVFLKAEDFAAAVPRIAAVNEGSAAAPGAVIAITGASLAGAGDVARGVPLPQELAGTQVLVNGLAAPLYAVEPGRIALQLPYATAESWSLVARRAGMESAPFRLAFAAASPVIQGVRRRDDGYLEIYATGLGAVSPAIAAGASPSSGEPFHRVTLPVTVRIGGTEVQPVFAGLLPYTPGWYQVNVKLPESAAGAIVLVAGERASAPFGL